MMKNLWIAMMALLWGVLAPALGHAQAEAPVVVKDAWARATVAQQTSSAVYMDLSAAQDARLIGAATPVAGNVQIHQMSLDANQVMRMSAVPALDLPAGKTVRLAPNGYHIMLTGLQRPLNVGETLPLTLTIETATHERRTLQLNVPVQPLSAGGPPMQTQMQTQMPMHMSH
jgi:periplasmic copper chaperone A